MKVALVPIHDEHVVCIQCHMRLRERGLEYTA